MRHIDPPQEQWDRLPTRLTPGEREVFELFDAKLPAEWEMYCSHNTTRSRQSESQCTRLRTGVQPIQSETTQNPINKIRLYEEELLDFIARVSTTVSGMLLGRQSPGLIFKAELGISLLVPYRAHHYRTPI